MPRLPLGSGSIAVDLPGCTVTVCEPPGGTTVDPRRAAERAVADPHGQPLDDLVEPGDSVAVVVTDITRSTPDDVLLEVLLEELAGAGVPREAVTVVIGLGLHRPLTDEELRTALGANADLAVNHDPDAAVRVGSVDGCPVAAHPALVAADHVVSTGIVELHQYAGFSGGGKTAAIGAGGEALIDYTHGPGMLAREGVRLGRVDDNPFRETIDRAADRLGVAYCLNVTPSPSGIIDASAGAPTAVVRDLATSARAALSVPVEGPFDAVVAGVGAPKDANLYQASRAATYIAFGDHNPLRPGGRIVIPATLGEGAGTGRGERRFYDRLRGAADPAALVEAMRDGYEPGAQRAFVVARALRDHDIYVTNSEAPAVVEACLMRARPTVADAIEPGSEVLVVPDALNTLLVAR